MPMLTIDIPNQGMWNAVTCTTLGIQYVVLENFRIHPFSTGTVRMRTTAVDPNAIRIDDGTPVMVDGNREGIVVMTDPKVPMIEYTDNQVVDLVSIDRISYRMNMSIDELHMTTVYETKSFNGIPFLVPSNTPTEDASVALSDDVDGCTSRCQSLVPTEVETDTNEGTLVPFVTEETPQIIQDLQGTQQVSKKRKRDTQMWICQRPWCRSTNCTANCNECIRYDGKAFKCLNKGMVDSNRHPLPDNHHGIVMTGGVGANAGYPLNMALYTGSVTRKGHVGCTIDIFPHTSSIVVWGSEYVFETYQVNKKSKIFEDFPNGLTGGTIDAIEPYEWKKRNYLVTINGTITNNPQLIRVV